MEQEHIYAMALSHIPGISLTTAHILYTTMGSATSVFENRLDIKSYVPDASTRLINALKDVDLAIKRAEKEMEFIAKKNVRVFAMNDNEYPQRMKIYDDAPITLYYCGNGDLNKAKMVSMVGTRKCSEYGKELCYNFVSDLKKYYPDTMIVSGLAYGIDINSHRAALKNDMDTVGVLAHGLDRIYPSVHRQTAVEMVTHGGLLTEYMSETTPEKGNFVARNRIVAGICDACIVVESAARGGSLITANIADAYNKDVFAFPGRTYDLSSAGCNALIKGNKAQMIESAEDFIEYMGWGNPLKQNDAPIQQELFIDLTEEEEKIVENLKGVDEKAIHQIVNETGLSYSRVSVLMFELELKGVIKVLGGARYRLLNRNI